MTDFRDARAAINTLCAGTNQCRLTFTAPLASAPFPYDGEHGDRGHSFFTEVDPETGARLHITDDGIAFSEHPHYDSNLVLFHLPPQFDLSQPFEIAVFFHQHQVTVPHDVISAGVLDQVNRSGRNVALVVPQLARDAVDSSPGKLFRAGGTANLMAEAASVLAGATGAPAAAFARAPVTLMGYSGGYKAIAYSLDRGGIGDRIRAVLLLDGIYDDVDMFASWLLANRAAAIFVALYSEHSVQRTEQVMTRLISRGLVYGRDFPPTLSPGMVRFVAIDTDHFSVLADGPPRSPITEFLLRLGV